MRIALQTVLAAVLVIVPGAAPRAAWGAPEEERPPADPSAPRSAAPTAPETAPEAPRAVRSRPALPPITLLHEGEPFPDIALPSAEDGRPLSVADFRGTKMVLHVFASW